MATYISRHSGLQIDNAVDKALNTPPISNIPPRNGQVLAWNNDEYGPTNAPLPSNIYASNILINHSNNDSIEDGEPLSNAITALKNTVRKGTAGTDITLIPQSARVPYITPGEQISLNELANKIVAKQYYNGYFLKESISTFPNSTRVITFNDDIQKILIHFEELQGDGTLYASSNSSKLIPVLTCSTGNTYTGYIELEHIGYTIKATVLSCTNILTTGAGTEYVSGNPTIYMAIDPLLGFTNLYLQFMGNRSLTGSIGVYEYIP